MSPKGHFCTLSLLKRNKAASWDEQKKKKKISPSFTHTHSHPWCLYLVTEFRARRVFSWSLPHLFQGCLCSDLGLFPFFCLFGLLCFLQAIYLFLLCKPGRPFTAEWGLEWKLLGSSQISSCSRWWWQRKWALVPLSSSAYAADNITVDFNKDLIFPLLPEKGIDPPT